MSKVIVITGANRGIGFALAKTLSAQGHKIIATARNPDSATALKALPNVIGVVKAEMADLASLPKVTEEIAKLAPDGIDELWNNAGQLQNDGLLPTIDPVSLLQELGVNVMAPLAITKGLLPSLRKRETKKIVFVTSAMGSLTLMSSLIARRLQGLPNPPTADLFTGNPYSIGKSALTMEAIGWHAALSPEGFTIIPVHPGWVQTDMTKGTGADVTQEDSVAGLLKVVADAKPKPQIELVNYDGKVLPW